MLSSCAPQEDLIRPNIRSMMASVPAGTARRVTPAYRFGDQFARQGGDLLDLMEVQGASYIVKAPASVAGGCYIEFDARVFVDGNELWPRGVGAAIASRGGFSPSTAWVVDILAWPDLATSNGYSHRVRIRPLDAACHWSSSYRGFFRPPDANTGRPLVDALLYQCEERVVSLEKDVPIACLHDGPTDKNYKHAAGCGADDAEQYARAHPFGVVFYIRLRHKPLTPTTLAAAAVLHPTRAEGG
ncbi:MAG TPA: hypothetical protein VNA25_07170, partial [Phycisphaerae bacterium]|nr:hypothetical protein [Phycisphaerae bacterium]